MTSMSTLWTQLFLLQTELTLRLCSMCQQNSDQYVLCCLVLCPVLLGPSSHSVTYRAVPKGGGVAGGKVGTHCQTTALAFWRCVPLCPFLLPPIFERFEGHRPPPPKSNIFNTKLSTKVIQSFLHSCLYSIQLMQCISQNRVNTNITYKLLLLLCS